MSAFTCSEPGATPADSTGVNTQKSYYISNLFAHTGVPNMRL